jgi:hypothetical protein
VGVLGDGGRSGSNRERLEAKGLRLKADAGSRRESNQVQAIAFFLADAGSGARTATGTGGYARSAGLVPNIYAGRGAALRRPRRRAQRQATHSPRFQGVPAIDQFRPLNTVGFRIDVPGGFVEVMRRQRNA